MEKPPAAAAAAADDDDDDSTNNSAPGATTANTRFLLLPDATATLPPPSCEGQGQLVGFEASSPPSSSTEVAVTPKFRVLEAQPKQQQAGASAAAADTTTTTAPSTPPAMNGLAATSSLLPLGQQAKEEKNWRQRPTFPAELNLLVHPPTLGESNSKENKATAASSDWIEPAVALFSGRLGHAGTKAAPPPRVPESVTTGAPASATPTAALPRTHVEPAAALATVVAHLGDVDEAAHRQRQQEQRQRRDGTAATGETGSAVPPGAAAATTTATKAATTAAAVAATPLSSVRVERGWDVTDRSEDPSAVRIARTGRFAVWSSHAVSAITAAEARLSEARPAGGRDTLRPTQRFLAATTAPNSFEEGLSDALRRVDPLATVLFAIRNDGRSLGQDVWSGDGAWSDPGAKATATSSDVDDAFPPHASIEEVPTKDEDEDVPLPSTCADPQVLMELCLVEPVENGSEALPENGVAAAGEPRVPGADGAASLPWRHAFGYDIATDLNSTGAAAPSLTRRFAVLDDGSGTCASPTTASTIRDGSGDRQRCRDHLRDFAARASLAVAKHRQSEAHLDNATDPLVPVLLTMVGASTTGTIRPRPEATDGSHGEVVEVLPTAIESVSSNLPLPEKDVDDVASLGADAVPISTNMVDEPAPRAKEMDSVLQQPKGGENDVNASSLPAGSYLTGAAELSEDPAERSDATHPSIPCDAPPVTMFSMISESDNVPRQVPSKQDSAVTHVPTAIFTVWGTRDETNSSRGGDSASSRRGEQIPNKTKLPAPGGTVAPPPTDPRMEQSYVSVLLRHPLNVVKPETFTEDAEDENELDQTASASIVEDFDSTPDLTPSFPTPAQGAVSGSVEDPSIASRENESANGLAALSCTGRGVGEVVMACEPAQTQMPLDEDTAVSLATSTELLPFSTVHNDVATPSNPVLDSTAHSSTQASIESPLLVKSSNDVIVDSAHAFHSGDGPSRRSPTQEPDAVPKGDFAQIAPSHDSLVTADVGTRFSTSAVAINGKRADSESIDDRSQNEDQSTPPKPSLDSQPIGAELSLSIESTHDLAVTHDAVSSSDCESTISASLAKEITNTAPSRAVLGANMSISTAGELSKNSNVSTLQPNVVTPSNTSEKSKTPELATKPSGNADVDPEASEQLHSTSDPSEAFAEQESSDDLKAVSSRGVGTLSNCELQTQHKAPARSVGPTLAEIVARHAVDSNILVESTVSKENSTMVQLPKAQSRGTVKSSVSKGPVNWKSIPLNPSHTSGAGRDKRRDHRSSQRQNNSKGGEEWTTVDRINGRPRSNDVPVDSIIANGALTLAASVYGGSQPSASAAQGEPARAEPPIPSPRESATPNAPSSDAPDDSASRATSSSDRVTNVDLESEMKSDITIYGATSFVAQHVLTYLHQASLTLARPLRITLGGRDAAKLGSLKERCARKMGLLSTMYAEATGMCSFNVFVAESDDIVALDGMVKRTSVVLNCAGPFFKYSSNVVGACARAGVDYVDITGEVRWAGMMRERYGTESAVSGSRIISFCGFDSIPSDIAVFAAVSALRKTCKKRAVDVVRATTWHSSVGGVNGGTVHTVLDVPFEPSQFLHQPVPFFIEDPLSLVLPRLKTYPSMQMTRNRFAMAEWLNLLPRAESIFALGVSIPFFMAVVNSKVVQASALALNYGPNFTYYERMVPVGYKLTTKLRLVSVVPALMVLLACSIGFLILKLPLVGFKLAKWLVPPGSGSSDQFCAAGHAEVYAEVSTAQNKAGLCDKANCMLKFQGGK
jgi:Saccharopine dehydrogenase NADP binding domain